ncbi:hypothetical protein HPB51_002918 [Rhipicephalus microplus]|uniref:MAM domain-containing protein n=1 Tax=Rhipicephalus microplus TaxID=6941 RepID=A0A9J6DSS5_RHIMP|nr:hypothetical protein HPB51_002918 [Rhipicephalus microplus]
MLLLLLWLLWFLWVGALSHCKKMKVVTAPKICVVCRENQIRFFYLLRGGSKPQLTLNVRYTKDGLWKPVWSASGQSHMSHFMAASVRLHETVPYQVAFTGEHQVPGFHSYIAIDDVTFSESCKAYDKELPAVPATPPPSACGDREFQCGATTQCIPVVEVCDFKSDCSNGADEERCGACEFSKDLCGMLNRYTSARFGWNWTTVADSKGQKYFPRLGSDYKKDGSFVAYSLLNSDAPQGRANPLITPRLGNVAASCAVSFYVYLPDQPSTAQRTPSATPPLKIKHHVDNVSTSLLWTRSGPQGKAWQKGQVQVQSEDKHRFIFEAVLPAYIPGVIAIDHFVLKDGYCESSNVCTFESGNCGWQLHNWEVTKGSSAMVPPSDHTNKAPHAGFHKASQHKCLRFWFFIAGLTAEALNVTNVIDDQREEHLWYASKSHAPSDKWYSAAVDITSLQEDATLVFEGSTSGDPGTAVAVDDISLGYKACLPPGSCSFEEDMCNWQNVEGRKYASWYRNQGPTSNLRNGLKGDHTLGTDEGYYLLLDRSDLSETGTAILESETLSIGPVACVKLYYYIKQNTDTKLSVVFADILGKQIGLATTVSATGPSKWTQLSVEGTNLPSAYIVTLQDSNFFAGNTSASHTQLRHASSLDSGKHTLLLVARVVTPKVEIIFFSRFVSTHKIFADYTAVYPTCSGANFRLLIFRLGCSIKYLPRKISESSHHFVGAMRSEGRGKGRDDTRAVRVG